MGQMNLMMMMPTTLVLPLLPPLPLMLLKMMRLSLSMQGDDLGVLE
jgi:hypothetical protein